MDEVGKLLRAATSKISLSVDVWTLSNYLSFLGVVAHLIGKLAFCLLPALFWPLIGQRVTTSLLTYYHRC